MPACLHAVVADLERLPPLADLAPYGPVLAQYDRFRSVYVELSRGCYKQCGFCEMATTGVAWKRLRKIPLATIQASVEHAIRAHGANYVLLADSIATTYKDHFLAFMAWMQAAHPAVSIQLNSTVDRWDADVAEACSRSPCTVWFGFESGSQRVLDHVIRKGTTVEQALAAARLCRDHRVPCAFNVLLGLPGETEEDLAATLAVLEAHPWVYPNPNIFNPLPGTELHDRCLREGLLHDPDDHGIWTEHDIRARGRGPIRGVDYARMLRHHHRLRALQAERAGVLAGWRTLT